jgi:hypothetical protein
LAVGRIEKIHRDVPVVTGNPRLATRHRNDIPATLLKQVSQHVTAGETRGTRDECGTLRLRHLISPLRCPDVGRGSKLHFRRSGFGLAWSNLTSAAIDE